ncbi:MAG TPA: AMP-binding protein [Candidatus Acidoferrum sp.]|nr:AMP-binding protein [Candidatus Acidoferrum sp.]
MQLNAQDLASESDAPRVGKFPDRARVERLQLRKLRSLFAAIIPANPFYDRKLAGCGSGLSFRTIEDYSRAVPTTTRHDIVKDRLANPPYGTNLTFPLETYIRCHQTSGTTTVPLRWLDTPESWNHIVENWVQILGAAGVTRRDRFLFAFSFGPFLGFWSALEAVHRLGYFCFPGGSMTSLARLQAILDNKITVLACTPTYAQHLGEVAREKDVSLTGSRLRLVIVAGEAGGSVPATRARIERLWQGATVFDHHGMTEVGPVTYQCPAQPGVLHVLESAYLPEVIEPQTSTAVSPGGTGELLLTTLDRVGSPLLRYRTGDLVKPRQRSLCACGRYELALEGGILGRSDDMVVVRGVNVYPSLVEELVRAHPEVTEYRVELDCRGALAELSVEVETSAECPDPASVKRRLEQSFQTALNLRVPVHLLPLGSLPRFEMKALRWAKITE